MLFIGKLSCLLFLCNVIFDGADGDVDELTASDSTLSPEELEIHDVDAEILRRLDVEENVKEVDQNLPNKSLEDTVLKNASNSSTSTETVCKADTYLDLLSSYLPQNYQRSDISQLVVNVSATEIKSQKIVCIPRDPTVSRNGNGNGTSEETNETVVTAHVEVLNNTELLERLSTAVTMPMVEGKDSTGVVGGNCAVVLFYAPWCTFCARVGPHYNALARAFPQLSVLAINAVHFSTLNSRYGTIAVPNILIFYNGKAIARFNNSQRSLDNMVAFVANNTGLKPLEPPVTVLPEDYEGPLQSSPTQDRDLLLWSAWLFVTFCLSVKLFRSSLGEKVLKMFTHPAHEHGLIDG